MILYQDYAAKLCEENEGYWLARQFSNPDNPQVHYNTTGPEIWEQVSIIFQRSFE